MSSTPIFSNRILNNDDNAFYYYSSNNGYHLLSAHLGPYHTFTQLLDNNNNNNNNNNNDKFIPVIIGIHVSLIQGVIIIRFLQTYFTYDISTKDNIWMVLLLNNL